MAKAKVLRTVLLDAGHGIETPGKRSPVWSDGSQYLEYWGNRDIRDRIAKNLTDAGYKDRFCYVTEGDHDYSLTERVEIVNDYAKHYGKHLCHLHSIHSDAFTKPSAKGWSIFTSPGQTQSDTDAEMFIPYVRATFPDRSIRTDKARDGDSDREAKFTILTKTICPAVLSENFFMTNENECRNILLKEIGRQKIAYMLSKGLIAIIERKTLKQIGG